MKTTEKLKVGANRLDLLIPELKNKSIGIVANQTSVIFKNLSESDEKLQYTHLVDSLISLKLDVKKVFAPEHGYRGISDAGEYVNDGIDIKTGLPIVSLYGKK
ncbi:MAG: exo-beta-N-acetylmuramidase NamZ domain-containing protein [Flavobacteriaceae bacterium]